MSDSEIRDTERAYRASGAPQDGEAYVQAVLRSTGLPSTFLIARVIETQRALHAQGQYRLEGPTRDEVRTALTRLVTPDDMVSFLRGGREWLEPPVPQFRPTSLAEGSRIHVVGSEGQPLGQTIYGAMVDDHNDPNAHLPHQRGVSAGEQYPGCHYAGCYEVATIHGELAEPMWCEGHVGGQLVTPTLGVPVGSAILCNHANENPGHCPCEPDCYCRQDGHTCSDVDAVHASNYEYRRASTGVTHRSRLPECRLCSRGAQWQFRQEPRLHVCAIHLAECRVNREQERQTSLAAMVRHHEAVDDV